MIIQKEPVLKTHKELARHIEGKTILLLNSLGKDSVLCLDWLCNYAKPKRIVSIFFRFLAEHPDDERYLNYLKKRYPSVEFLEEHDAVELSLIVAGVFQSPIAVTHLLNHSEYSQFYRSSQLDEICEKHGIDYMCRGDSKYESFARRTKFHQKGLVFQGVIFPLGMMSKEEVIGLIKSTGVKIHPVYKYSGSGYDTPSYWKMRAGIVSNPKYWEKLLEVYPLLELDRFRYEVLLKEKK